MSIYFGCINRGKWGQFYFEKKPISAILVLSLNNWLAVYKIGEIHG